MALDNRWAAALVVAAFATIAAVQAQQPTAPPAVPPDKAAKAVASVPFTNAGFESTAPGKLGAPEGWWTVQHAGPRSYVFSLDTKHKRSGERSLRLENVGPEPFGTIFQALDATPYRGKTLRLSGWIRTEATSGNAYGRGAGLLLHTMRGGYLVEGATMQSNAINGSTEWTRYELTLLVPVEADRLEAGLTLFGPGIAWLDDTALDVVEPPKASP